jgi:hypothetical protein
VKKSAWVSHVAALKMSWLAVAFILCSFGCLASMAVTHATSSKCPHLQSCNPSPSPAPTSPSPAPTSTSSPSPTPTSAPTFTPTPLPNGTPSPFPQVQPDSTTAVFPVSTGTAGTPPSTPSTSSTVIAGIVPSNQMTVTRTDPTSTNEPSQSTANQGMNLLLPSLGVGAPFLLFSGALLWLLWRRQTSQHKPVPQTQSGNALTSAWMSNRGTQPPSDRSDFVSSATLAPRGFAQSGISPFEATELMQSSQQAERSSDLFPMPITLTQAMQTIMALDKAFHSSRNGPIQLAYEDAVDLSLQSPTQAKGSSKNGDVGVLISPPMEQMGNAQLSRTSACTEPPDVPVTIGSPSINDDPMLAMVMQQAQTGLFVLLGRENSLHVSSSHG